MQNTKERAHELRKQEDGALIEKLGKLRSELVGLRTSKVSSAPQVKLARIRVRNHWYEFLIWDYSNWSN